MGSRDRTDKWLDWLLPASPEDPSGTDAHGANLARATALTLVPVLVIYVGVYATLHGALSLRAVLCAAALLILLGMIWAMGRYGVKVPGRVLASALLVIILAAEHLDAQLQLFVLPWMVAAPLVTTLLAGARFGLTAVALAGVAHIALFIGRYLDYLPLPLGGAAQATAAHGHGLSVLDTVLAMAVAMAVGTLYEASRRRSERLAQRTMADLRRANRELRSARDRANEANRAKTQFVANISHELRTPMNGVIGMTDLLRDSDVNDEQLEYVDTVHRSARSLLAIIDDILDFSKLDFDKLELSVKRFDPETLIEEALSLLAADAYTKGLEVSASVARDVPSEVISDAGRLRQVLLNLLTNAIKFTRSGEVNLTCSLVKLDEPHALLRFEVNDTGVGIPPPMASRIFDAFYQTDNSTTRQHGGTGLGLAISKRLVELMGGQIGVDSQPDQGSRFYFTHPVQVPEDVLDVGDDRSGTFTGLRGLCLVLGDRPRSRTALTSLLEREGVLSDNAPSLEEALKMMAQAQARDLPYRVCIIDVPGEGEDALEIADRLRRAPITPQPGIVLLIPPNQRALRQRAQALGFATPVSKPARRAPLMAGIASALSEASRSRPSRTASGRVVPMSPSTPSKKLLLAEDNETNQRTAMLMLKKLGYEVELATNGRQVLEKLATHRYDAILMDCQMPVLDGYQASAKIRNLPSEARHTTIIAMTAHASAADRRRCLDAGMNDYLPKPVRFEDLRGMLDKWLHARGAVSSLTPAEGMDPVQTLGGVDIEMLTSLRRMAGEDQHMVNALVQTYLEEAPRLIETLATELAIANADGVLEAAHKLKSSSGNLGANRLSDMCRRLERDARAKDLVEADDLLAEIQMEFEHVKSVLHPLSGAPQEVRL